MTLEQLRIFVAVAEREHLTRAADVLNLTPSAVSAAIRALEERHEVRLFHRVGRGIELTGAGRIFLDEARATLARARAAELALTELGGLRRGTLSIQASQTIASYWLPALLVQFHDRHPGVGVDLAVGNTATVSKAVFEGAAELGFIEGDIDIPDLATRIVAHDHLIVVVAPDHPWAGRGQIAQHELVRAHWVLREPGSGTRSVFETALAERGIDPGALNVSLELPSNEAVRGAVEVGRHVAVMSELAAEPFLHAGRLVRAGVDLPPRAFSMVWHPQRYRTRASSALEGLIPALPGDD